MEETQFIRIAYHLCRINGQSYFMYRKQIFSVRKQSVSRCFLLRKRSVSNNNAIGTYQHLRKWTITDRKSAFINTELNNPKQEGSLKKCATFLFYERLY